MLIEHMLATGLPQQLTSASSLRSVYEAIAAYPSLGPFLAYQLAIDLNYTNLINFSEDDFVVPGPGALSGIAKCFPGLRDVAPVDVIRWMVDDQQEQCYKYGVELKTLFGRPLTLIDCQNLFCETDKYARVMHPTVVGLGKRTRIKQIYAPKGPLARPFFPPKWGINDAIRSAAPIPLASA